MTSRDTVKPLRSHTTTFKPLNKICKLRNSSLRPTNKTIDIKNMQSFLDIPLDLNSVINLPNIEYKTILETEKTETKKKIIPEANRRSYPDYDYISLDTKFNNDIIVKKRSKSRLSIKGNKKKIHSNSPTRLPALLSGDACVNLIPLTINFESLQGESSFNNQSHLWIESAIEPIYDELLYKESSTLKINKEISRNKNNSELTLPSLLPKEQILMSRNSLTSITNLDSVLLDDQDKLSNLKKYQLGYQSTTHLLKDMLEEKKSNNVFEKSNILINDIDTYQVSRNHRGDLKQEDSFGKSNKLEFDIPNTYLCKDELSRNKIQNNYSYDISNSDFPVSNNIKKINNTCNYMSTNNYEQPKEDTYCEKSSFSISNKIVRNRSLARSFQDNSKNSNTQSVKNNKLNRLSASKNKLLNKFKSDAKLMRNKTGSFNEKLIRSNIASYEFEPKNSSSKNIKYLDISRNSLDDKNNLNMSQLENSKLLSNDMNKNNLNMSQLENSKLLSNDTNKNNLNVSQLENSKLLSNNYHSYLYKSKINQNSIINTSNLNIDLYNTKLKSNSLSFKKPLYHNKASRAYITRKDRDIIPILSETRNKYTDQSKDDIYTRQNTQSLLPHDVSRNNGLEYTNKSGKYIMASVYIKPQNKPNISNFAIKMNSLQNSERILKSTFLVDSGHLENTIEKKTILFENTVLPNKSLHDDTCFTKNHYSKNELPNFHNLNNSIEIFNTNESLRNFIYLELPKKSTNLNKNISNIYSNNVILPTNTSDTHSEKPVSSTEYKKKGILYPVVKQFKSVVSSKWLSPYYLHKQIINLTKPYMPTSETKNS